MTQETKVDVRQKAWGDAQGLVTEFTDEYVVSPITTDVEYQSAGEDLKTVKGMRRDLDTERKKITVPQDAAKAATMKQWKATDAPLKRIEDDLRAAGGDYLAEQRRIAAEAQAEVDRIAREAAEQAQLEEAEKLEAAGRVEEAEAALEPAAVEQAVQQRRVNVNAAPPKVEGIAITPVWKFKVVDEKMLPRKFTQPNTVAIWQYVRGLKDKAEIPGVHIYPEDSMRVGR